MGQAVTSCYPSYNGPSYDPYIMYQRGSLKHGGSGPPLCCGSHAEFDLYRENMEKAKFRHFNSVKSYSTSTRSASSPSSAARARRSASSHHRGPVVYPPPPRRRSKPFKPYKPQTALFIELENKSNSLSSESNYGQSTPSTETEPEPEPESPSLQGQSVGIGTMSETDSHCNSLCHSQCDSFHAHSVQTIVETDSEPNWHDFQQHDTQSTVATYQSSLPYSCHFHTFSDDILNIRRDEDDEKASMLIRDEPKNEHENHPVIVDDDEKCEQHSMSHLDVNGALPSLEEKRYVLRLTSNSLNEYELNARGVPVNVEGIYSTDDEETDDDDESLFEHT